MNSTENGTFHPEYEMSLIETVLFRLDMFFITPLGIIGNVLIIVILASKKRRNSASSVYFRSLAVSDSIILLSGIYSGIMYSRLQYIGCIVSTYIRFTSVQVSSWLLVAVAMERVLGVKSPHRVKFFCTQINAVKVVAGIVGVILAMNTCILVSYDITNEFCQPSGPLEYFMIEVYRYTDLCISIVVPSMCLIITSVIIIVQLKKVSGISTNLNMDRVTSISKILLAANLTFLVTMTPYATYDILIGFPPDHSTIDIWSALVTLAQTNAAANFFVYSLSGTRFRNDAKQLFIDCVRKVQHTPTSSAFIVEPT